MPRYNDPGEPRNMRDASQMMREGGKRLRDLTGEDVPPDMFDDEVGIRAGFRRLMGVKKAARVYGGNEE